MMRSAQRGGRKRHGQSTMIVTGHDPLGGRFQEDAHGTVRAFEVIPKPKDVKWKNAALLRRNMAL